MDIQEQVKKSLKKGTKNKVKPVKVADEKYDLYVFSEDEELNIFEGFLYSEVESKSELNKLLKYRPPISGYTPRIGIFVQDNQIVLKDYRKDTKLKKTVHKINKTFKKKLLKALEEPNESNFNKLFDRTDVIEEFWILYRKTRDFLLNNVKGKSNEAERLEFVDNLMMQMLTLWYLQERGFFNRDTSYFVTKFKEIKQKKLEGGFKNYYDFLNYFFDEISSKSEQYCEDDKIGNVVVVGPAIFLDGERESEAVQVPDKCFYKEGFTDILINTPPKKVDPEVPLLNLFESRDWTEGNIDEFVLGAVYEKLITEMERKKTGAYYTPEAITSYICENTIKPYLLDRVNEEFKDKEDFESIDAVVEEGDKRILLFLFDTLREIKILDPAVGSAHFLENAIKVIVDIYEKIWRKAKEIRLKEGLEITAADERGEIKPINLLEVSDEQQFKIYVKFFIILSKNVYGVDINPNAIKVAKARLFLTLAKHFDSKKGYFIRFPNVHFNLRVGNSLIGYTELEKEKKKVQTPLDFFVKEGESLYVVERIKVVGELEDYLKKISKSLKIDDNIIEEIKELNEVLSKSEVTRKEFEKVLWVKEKLIRILIASLNSKYAIPMNELLNQVTELFSKKLNEMFSEEYGIDLQGLKRINTFHWILEFPEVLLKNDGFDVVLGNPPYVRADVEDERLNTQRKIIENSKEYKTLYEKWDLFLVFIERSIRSLLNNNGKFSFIVSDALCTVKYAKKMRDWLSSNFYIPEINYYEGFQVFVGVGIVPIVFFVDKSKPPAKTNKVIHTGSFDNISSRISVSQNSPSLFRKTKFDITELGFGEIVAFGDMCFISKGMVLNSDEKKAKGEFGKEDLISDYPTEVNSKKYVEGKDISRYKINNIRYLEWNTDRCPYKVSRPTFKELYEGKKIMRGRVTEGVIDNNNIVTNDSIMIFRRFIDLKGVENRSIKMTIIKHNDLSREKLENISGHFTYEYLLAIINSTFANRYLNAVRRHKLKNYFYPDDFRKLPIKKIEYQNTFVNLIHWSSVKPSTHPLVVFG